MLNYFIYCTFNYILKCKISSSNQKLRSSYKIWMDDMHIKYLYFLLLFVYFIYLYSIMIFNSFIIITHLHSVKVSICSRLFSYAFPVKLLKFYGSNRTWNILKLRHIMIYKSKNMNLLSHEVFILKYYLIFIAFYDVTMRRWFPFFNVRHTCT